MSNGIKEVDIDDLRIVPGLSDKILNLLSRVTSSGRFVPEIDGLRFFAIFGVIMCHIAEILTAHELYSGTAIKESFLYWFQQHGAFGVHLFFSISGFILSLPFAEGYLFGKPLPKLKKYYFRRVTRLEPPYIICLTIGLVGVSIYGSSFWKEIPHYFASLFYLHAIIYHQASTIGGILWSLEIEVQFYILAPFLAKVFLIRNTIFRRIIIITVCILSMLWQNTIQSSAHEMIFLTILGNIQYFLVGFFVADIYLADWRTIRPRRFLWDLALAIAFLLFTVIFYYVEEVNQWISYPFLLTVILFYFASFRGIITNKIVTNRWLVVFGGMCYSIYLYHMITIRTMWVLFTRNLVVTHNYVTDYLIQMALLCTALLVICSILFILFEKPFMQRDWPKKWSAAIVKYFDSKKRLF